MPDKISIVIVDDKPLIREGYEMMIARFSQFRLTGAFTNKADFIRSLEVTRPRAALIDLENDWQSFVKDLQLDHPGIALLIPASYNEVSIKNHNYKNEIYPILERNMQHEDAPAVKQLLQAVSWTCNALVIQEMLLDFLKGKIRSRVWAESGLSDIEERVLSLSILGWNNQEIADRLFISRRTIEWHKENIAAKIGADTPVDLIRYGIRYHLETKFGHPKKTGRKEKLTG